MKALVAGFEPFAGDAVNPAREAVLRLPSRLGELALETRGLPAGFGGAIAALDDALVTVRPDIVLAVGLAGGRAELSLERVAINVDEARIRDNDGEQPIDRPIIADGPAAYFSGLPVKAAVAAMREAGFPGGVSESARPFFFKHLFFWIIA